MLRALGRRLRVTTWNDDRAGRPLLAFNGIGMNAELLEPLAARLNRRVIAFDMPGVGGSPDPLVPYTATTMAATASVVLDRLGVARADVLGISWGGGIAQQFALQHGPRIGRLALAATSAGVAMAPGSPALLARLVDPTELTAGKAFQRNLALLYNGGGAAAPVSLNAATPPSPLGWLYQLGALAAWTSLALLPWLDVPTLILAGDEDRVVPPLNARLLHALIPDSRLELIAGGGHLFALSHAEQVAGALDRFLAVDTA
jgi:pimeloyl-ACP methyl ester carboxylesterase